MRPLVEAYHEAVGVYVKLATSFDKLAVELFGFCFVEPMQPGGSPPIAAIREDGQRDIDVHIEAHFNAWCELAKSLKRKGGFPDTQTESRLVQRITPLFSTIAFQ